MRLRRADPIELARIRKRAREYKRARYHADPEFRARTVRHSVKHVQKKRAKNPHFAADQKRYQSQYHLERSADPAYAERRRSNTRRLRSDPEYSEKERASARASDRLRYSRPEVRRRRLRYMKERLQTDPHARELHRTNSHKRRARCKDAGSPGVSPAEWHKIVEAFSIGGRPACAYCRKPCRPTRDHVVPLARGGRDEPSNVVPACKRCNCSKRDRLLSEWHRAPKNFSDAVLLPKGQDVLRAARAARGGRREPSSLPVQLPDRG